MSSEHHLKSIKVQYHAKIDSKPLFFAVIIMVLSTVIELSVLIILRAYRNCISIAILFVKIESRMHKIYRSLKMTEHYFACLP